MKKIYTLCLFIALVSTATAQILSRSENWPNTGWSLTGAYTPAALVLNPRINSQFKYVESLVTPPGGSSSFYIESPFFSLKPAFDGGEKGLKINFSLSFQTFAKSVLFIQYWNADTSTWVTLDGADIQIVGDFSTCANMQVTSLLDFANFTTNKLQNFRYRFGINDTGNQIPGVCMESPVLSSFMVKPPSNLNVININTTSATLDWVGNNGYGTDTSYDIEYGFQGFTLGTGTNNQHVSPPFSIFGLVPGTNYAFYVRENVHDNNAANAVYSSWAGPKTFTTATLGLVENELKGFKLYPNPIKDIVWMESEKTLNEVKVYNYFGQELKNIKSNKPNENIDMSSLSAGFYFIKVTRDNDSGVYKIVKK